MSKAWRNCTYVNMFRNCDGICGLCSYAATATRQTDYTTPHDYLSYTLPRETPERYIPASRVHRALCDVRSRMFGESGVCSDAYLRGMLDLEAEILKED